MASAAALATVCPVSVSITAISRARSQICSSNVANATKLAVSRNHLAAYSGLKRLPSAFRQESPLLQKIQKDFVHPVRKTNYVSPSADWKQEILWTEASIKENEVAADQLFSIVVDVSSIPELRAGFTKPGQFVQMKVGDSKPAFLAIASSPKAAEAGYLEFLIKDVEGSTASQICKLPVGSKVEISQVMGKGFNISQVSPPEDFPTLVLLATGSGISPVRSLIEAGFGAAKRGDVRLYYGAHNLSRMAYQQSFEAWEASGVKVIPVLSQPDDSWHGDRGFVQHAFASEAKIEDGSRAGAILCGQKGMVEEATALLLEAGLAKDKILLNF